MDQWLIHLTLQKPKTCAGSMAGSARKGFGLALGQFFIFGNITSQQESVEFHLKKKKLKPLVSHLQTSNLHSLYKEQYLLESLLRLATQISYKPIKKQKLDSITWKKELTKLRKKCTHILCKTVYSKKIRFISHIGLHNRKIFTNFGEILNEYKLNSCSYH